MRVIFLDIDGVVATDRTYKAWRKAKCPSTFEAHVALIDPALLALVDGLAQEVGAGIVVSSSWRIPSTVNDHPVDDLLQAAGLTVPILGHTPEVTPSTKLLERLKQRGHEINAYVVANGLAIEDLVVFDDDTGASASPAGSPVRHGSRVIFTPESVGINPNHVARARKLFGLPWVQPRKQTA